MVVSKNARRSKRLRFGLRGALVAICIIAALLAFWAAPMLRQRWAVEEINKAGGSVHFDPPTIETDSLDSLLAEERAPSAPDWLRSLAGEDMRTVNIKDRDLTGTNALEQVASLEGLESVSLTRSVFDEDELQALANCRSLRILYLHYTTVTDDGIAFVRNLDDLEHLGLAYTQVTDRSVEHISECTTLTYLCLVGTSVGDESIPFLAKLKALRELEVVKTKFTEQGLEELKAALPDCKIVH